MKLTWHRMVYPLRYPFKLSYGTYTERLSYWVKLEQGDGIGWGELSLVPYYNKSEADIQQQLQLIQQKLETKTDDWTPAALYDEIHGLESPIDPFVLSAVDTALYDLYGQLTGQPIWQIVGGSQTVTVESSLTVTEDDWREKLSWQWPSLKLKMGFEGDIDLIRQIRAEYEGSLRIDANGGWLRSELPANLDVLSSLGVDLVEQPLAKDRDSDLDGIDTSMILVADESFQGINDIERLQPYYKVINIKLQKCGGITPALRIISKAKSLGFQVMAGCMTESSIGIGAMCHLGSHFDYIDLDGEYIINIDQGVEPFVVRGKIQLSDRPGLGKAFNGILKV